MDEKRRHERFGRILPTVFVQAVFDIGRYSEFEIGSALRGAYHELGLLRGTLEKDAARFSPKGEAAKRLCANTIQDMRDFDAKGTDEENYRIITNDLYKTLTLSPYPPFPTKRYGLIVRGVLLEPFKSIGLDEIAVDEYLERRVKPDPLCATILFLRENYQQREAERKRTREAARIRQQRYRELQRASALHAPPAPTEDTPAVNTPSAEFERVMAALVEQHPKKSGNPKMTSNAVAVALGEIGADDLIRAHALWRENSLGTDLRYIPTLAKWLTDRKWKDFIERNGVKPWEHGKEVQDCVGEVGVTII